MLALLQRMHPACIRAAQASLAVLLFAGCADSAVDRDFRTKVESISISGSGDFTDRSARASLTVGATIRLRDPDAKQIKTPAISPAEPTVILNGTRVER